MITTVISFSEATACAFILAAVLIQIRRSDRQPNGRHEHDERVAETRDLPMSDVEWFRSLKEPRPKLSYAYEPTAGYVIEPTPQDEYTCEPGWVPVEREPLKPLPPFKRPVPAVPDSAVSTAGTGLPPGEIAPWVLDTLRGTDSILDSICAKAGAL